MRDKVNSVLIVDDEPAVCSLIRDELSAHGFTCAVACEPGEAKRLMEQGGFPVVVADVVMPGVSGIDLLAFSRHRRPGSKVILVSGHSDTGALAEALRLGAYDFLPKPLDLKQLVDLVCRACDDGPDAEQLSVRAATALQGKADAERTSLESVKALVGAVEAKDPYTRRHSEHVAHYAGHLSRYAEVPSGEIERIRVAALLHDVGKIGVPDQVLTKPGPLTEDEFALIRRHPLLGEEILRNLSCFAHEATLVRHHHERWDGGGYPDGRAGEQIPIGSRVVHLADAIDAMLMRRTYKDAYPVERVLQELHEGAGGQFDPELAEAAATWCNFRREMLIQPVAYV